MPVGPLVSPPGAKRPGFFCVRWLFAENSKPREAFHHMGEGPPVKGFLP